MAYRIDVRPEQPPGAPECRGGVAERASRTRRRELDRAQSTRATIAHRLNLVAAVLVATGGYVHFCLYRHGYRFIPKIGVSFLVQFMSSAVLAGALVVKGRQLRLGRRAVAPGQLIQLIRLSAIGLSVGTLAALGLAHTPGGLFQFHEIGLRPAPQSLIAIIAESFATVVLAVGLFEGRPAVTRPEIPIAAASPGREAIRDAA